MRYRFTIYVFVLIVYANQETLADKSMYKLIGRIVISRAAKKLSFDKLLMRFVDFYCR